MVDNNDIWDLQNYKLYKNKKKHVLYISTYIHDDLHSLHMVCLYLSTISKIVVYVKLRMEFPLLHTVQLIYLFTFATHLISLPYTHTHSC